MRSSKGDLLIQELLEKPEKFNEAGKAYQLLEEYFNGFPKKTLPPLLENANKIIQGAAVWIVSELGKDGQSLLPHVLPLLSSQDRYLKYHALEVVMVCSVDEHVQHFVNVVQALESEDEVIRGHSMRLISNASQAQLATGLKMLKASGPIGQSHREGLAALHDFAQQAAERVQGMIKNPEPLVRKYGVMVAKRLLRKLPDLISNASKSPDPEIAKFAKEAIEDASIQTAL